MSKLWQRFLSYVSEHHRLIMAGCAWVSAILLVCVGVPYLYGVIPVFWLRLLVVSIAAVCLIFLFRQMHHFHYSRLHGGAPERGRLSFVWVNWLVSLWIVCFLFAVFGLLLRLFNLPVVVTQSIFTYGTLVLSVLLFPAVAIMLYIPIVAKVKIRPSITLFLRGFIKLYPALFVVSLLLATVNWGLSLLIHNTLVSIIISIALSSALWTISWEGCLNVFLKDSKI